MKCEYCGRVFSIGLAEAQVPRCQNHPDQLATRTCSDCGGFFCEDCLTNYELQAQRGESATLSLCSDCLRSRYADRADRVILGSVAFFLLGTLFAGLALTTGMEMVMLAFVFYLMGAAGLIYGFLLRKHAGNEILPSQPSDESQPYGD